MTDTTKIEITNYLYTKGKIIIWQNGYSISELCNNNYLKFVEDGITRLSSDKPDDNPVALVSGPEFKVIEAQFIFFIYQWISSSNKNNPLLKVLGEDTLEFIRNIFCPFYPFC